MTPKAQAFARQSLFAVVRERARALYILLVIAVVLLTWAGISFGQAAFRAQSPHPTAGVQHGPYLVSLGGSIAAGVGLQPRSVGKYPAACGQTGGSYAVTLARAVKLPLVQVACSGAQTSRGFFDPQMVGHQPLAPQVSAVRSKLQGSIVTVFIGANDIRWMHTQLVCFRTGCPPAPGPDLGQGLQNITANVRSTVQDLHAAGARTILVNQYYSVLSAQSTPNCTPYHLTAEDVSNYRAALLALNQAIAQGVQQAQTPALLVANNFEGHGMCTHNPWIQGLRSQYPFHPNASGQDAIAQTDEQALRTAGLL